MLQNEHCGVLWILDILKSLDYHDNNDMKRLFEITNDKYSNGNVILSWHPESNFIASTGNSGE